MSLRFVDDEAFGEAKDDDYNDRAKERRVEMILFRVRCSSTQLNPTRLDSTLWRVFSRSSQMIGRLMASESCRNQSAAPRSARNCSDRGGRGSASSKLFSLQAQVSSPAHSLTY